MFENTGWGRTVGICKQALQAASLRQRVIADNIANVNTPGFKRSEVSFERELAQALQLSERKKLPAITTDPRYIHFGNSFNPAEISPRVFTEYGTVLRNDGNNVDINREMVDLAKNTIMYNALITRISSKFRSIKSIIQGGR